MLSLLASPNVHQRLFDKYRPTRFDEVIVSPHTQINAIKKFTTDPYPAAWLFFGASGIGKTSVSRIMANQLAVHPVHVQHWAGNDVDVHAVREIERTMISRPLFGGFNVCLIDEADAISSGASVRMLAALENLGHGVIIMTSNTQIEHFDSRLRSRLLKVAFSAHGLAPKAMIWLQEIALKEGLNLSENEAEAIVRQTKTNLRECLKMLECRLLGTCAS